MIEKQVEKLLRGGNNTAVIQVKAEVCQHCGERLYSKATITKFEEIRMKLKKNEVSNFELLGETYKVTDFSK